MNSRRALPLGRHGCRASLVGAASLALGGCMVGPDYETPKSAMPEGIASSSTQSSSSATTFTTAAPVDRWWEVFKDARLDALIDEARLKNEDLHAALARLHAARAVARQAFAPLLPTLAADGSDAYQQQARATFLFPQPTEPYQVITGIGDMSYELDLWGRVRRGLESATADVAATEEDRRNVEITLVADVAQTYLDLGEADESLAIARESVKLRTESLELVESRIKLGVAAELELERAKGELESAKADVPEAERRRAVGEHRLAILIGRPADVRFEGGPPMEFTLPPEVPVGLPSELLERRPDIRAAEQRVRSSNARIGEAIADYFPRFTLIASAGYSSLQWGKLASPAAQLWSIGPSVHLPIFEGGRTYYSVLEQEARTDESVALYRSTVLRAFGEVADSITGIAKRAEVRDRQAAAAESARRAVDLADTSYRQGATSYLEVIDAQRTLLTARNALLQAQRQVLGDLVQLEKALGGGWRDADGASRRP